MPSSDDYSGNDDGAGISRYRKNNLHDCFSAAAIALTKLYQESSNAYEDGYRDGLLYVYRYVWLTSRVLNVAIDSEEAPKDNASNTVFDGEERSLSSDSTVASQKLLNFIQKTLKLRKERVACARGTAEGRCRPRDHSPEEEKVPHYPTTAPAKSLPPLSDPSAQLKNEKSTTTEKDEAYLNVEAIRRSGAQRECALLNLREAHAHDIADIDCGRVNELHTNANGNHHRHFQEMEPPFTRLRCRSPMDYHRK
ncbi:unnamed protein product [Phytomonas sp. Hart1]|nr:unnamed protein product [Phytomonas sp. Hart1]|eukprot:CCW72012.1 unnamed protein product [Phytomonas sp. isolate Hart1]